MNDEEISDTKPNHPPAWADTSLADARGEPRPRGVWHMTAAGARAITVREFSASSDFAGGSGEDFRATGEGRISITIPPDPDCRGQPGYDYVFCIQVRNGPAPTRLGVDALMPDSEPGIDWAPSRIPLFASADCRTWFVLDDVKAAPSHREFRFTLDLAPGEVIYCSNSIPCPSAWMMEWLERLVAAGSAWARLEHIGTSALGRPLPVAVVTDPAVPDAQKDRVLVTSGFHPAEPDWLATTAILEALTSEGEWASRLRRDYIFDIVPHVNPDGFDMGANASNAHGVNMYWDFRRADPETSPEAVALWQWVTAHPPDLYIDYHAYVYQLQKDYRPYIRPASEYPPAARPAVRAMDRAFIALCGGRGVRGAATSDPLSLAPQLTAHFGTITYPKFHMHLYHGVDACRRLGVDVVEALLCAAQPYRPLRERTGRAPWTPRAGDTAATALQQAPIVVKARNVLRRAGQRVLGRAVRESVALPAAPGLPDHWSTHLWRDRARATPVFVFGEPAGTGRGRP